MPTVAAPDQSRPPGWYTQPGDLTMRWWSGTEWVGQPSAINPSIIPGASTRGRRAASKWSGLPVGIIAASMLLSFILSSLPEWVPGMPPPLGSALSSGGALFIGLITILLAFVDRHGQLGNGQPTAASGFWILLTPIAYLAARGYHVSRYRRGAWVPFWVYLSSVLVTVVFGVVAVASAITTVLSQYRG